MSPGNRERKIRVMRANRRKAWLYILSPLMNVGLGLVSGNKNQSKLHFDGHCRHRLQGLLQINVHRLTWWKHTASLKEKMTSFKEIASPQNFMLHDLKNGKMAMMITPLLEIQSVIIWTTTKYLGKSYKHKKSPWSQNTSSFWYRFQQPPQFAHQRHPTAFSTHNPRAILRLKTRVYEPLGLSDRICHTRTWIRATCSNITRLMLNSSTDAALPTESGLCKNLRVVLRSGSWVSEILSPHGKREECWLQHRGRSTSARMCLLSRLIPEDCFFILSWILDPPVVALITFCSTPNAKQKVHSFLRCW